MPVFAYKAVTDQGRRVEGTLAAASEHAVLAELESRHLSPVEVQPKRQRALLAKRIPARAVAASYLQMADLLGAGVPMLRSLRLLARGKSHPRLARVYEDIMQRVRDGGDLADAMAERPDVFPRVHVAMVRAGERGGFIETVYEKLGRLVEAQAELRSKLIGSLIYPAVLITVGLGILTIIFAFFVPKFRTLFTNRLEDLPWVTDAVFAVADLVTRYGLVTLVVLIVLFLVARALATRPAVRRTLAAWQLRIPIAGNLVRWLAVARFCRLLGTMDANGVPLLGAMTIARDAAGHPLLEDAITEATEAVRRGQPLAGPLAASGLFDEEVVEMISVGEASGHVDQVLLRVAGVLDNRVNRRLAVAVQLVEPLLLLAIALVVAFVAVGLILPLVRLTTSV